jgi:hypothetical protein
MRRRLAILLGVTAVVLVLAGPASALHCFVVKKPQGAGSVGTATFDVVTHHLTTDQPLEFTPSGSLKGGGFLTVTLVAGTTVLATEDLFFQTNLPDGAHESGPGTTECDGVGIDDVLECVADSA